MSLPPRQMTPKESREWNSWLSELMETVRPAPVANETDRERQKRISSLLGDFNKFCKYYTHFRYGNQSPGRKFF